MGRKTEFTACLLMGIWMLAQMIYLAALSQPSTLRGKPMKTASIVFIALWLAALSVCQDAVKPAVPAIHTLHCGTLIQPADGHVQHDVWITIEGDRIKDVRESAGGASGAETIDLSDHACLDFVMKGGEIYKESGDRRDRVIR
jgi:hypothetical protein